MKGSGQRLPGSRRPPVPGAGGAAWGPGPQLGRAPSAGGAWGAAGLHALRIQGMQKCRKHGRIMRTPLSPCQEKATALFGASLERIERNFIKFRDRMRASFLPQSVFTSHGVRFRSHQSSQSSPFISLYVFPSCLVPMIIRVCSFGPPFSAFSVWRTRRHQRRSLPDPAMCRLYLIEVPRGPRWSGVSGGGEVPPSVQDPEAAATRIVRRYFRGSSRLKFH